MKFKFLSIFSLAIILFTACDSDSTSDEFMDNNPDAIARLITSISVVSAQDPTDNATITINYDSNNRVTSVSDGEDTGILAYENGELASLTSNMETFNVEDLYESPYDAFETGEVINYDSNNNPQNIRFFETEYDWQTNSDVTVEYRAEVMYDDKPNPYFYTIQAAGGIAIMDEVELNFSADVNAPEIVQARMLFPSRNIKKVTYSDMDGEVLGDVVADFAYNSDNYPTSGTVTETKYDDGVAFEINVFTLTYTYLPTN
ncbi:hypothetical protein [uncultured Psychroserpens sp.]|uniref:hypothetical protein n=1 Tax=uncultured Psychroserpens sp. TaxID=255436 RepID=UPI00261BFD6D|nr:hypothetical protein [uncultured Psychroserpens sp.]